MKRTIIITPCFNEAERLPEYLECIKRQTVKLELVAVDDGSSDKTYDIIKGADILHAERNDRNIGITRTMNRLLEIVQDLKPDYLTWGGVDEELFPNSIERRIAHLQETGAAIMFSGADALVGTHRITYPNVLSQFERIKKINFENIYKELLQENFLQTPILIDLKKIDFEDLYLDVNTKYFCDWEQYLRLALKYRISFLNESTGCSDWDGNNFSKPNPSRFFEKFCEMIYVLKRQPGYRTFSGKLKLPLRIALCLYRIAQVYARRFGLARPS